MAAIRIPTAPLMNIHASPAPENENAKTALKACGTRNVSK
jgi:hypothetical protein